MVIASNGAKKILEVLANTDLSQRHRAGQSGSARPNASPA